MKFSSKLYLISLVQSIYYAITGIWPLVHIESFVWASGPKIDLWLVKTVGALILVIGVLIFMAAQRRRITPEIMLLAISSALALTIIDIYYVAIDRIWPIYLADAAIEILLIIGWIICWQKAEKQRW